MERLPESQPLPFPLHLSLSLPTSGLYSGKMKAPIRKPCIERHTVYPHHDSPNGWLWAHVHTLSKVAAGKWAENSQLSSALRTGVQWQCLLTLHLFGKCRAPYKGQTHAFLTTPGEHVPQRGAEILQLLCDWQTQKMPVEALVVCKCCWCQQSQELMQQISQNAFLHGSQGSTLSTLLTLIFTY